MLSWGIKCHIFEKFWIYTNFLRNHFGSYAGYIRSFKTGTDFAVFNFYWTRKSEGRMDWRHALKFLNLPKFDIDITMCKVMRGSGQCSTAMSQVWNMPCSAIASLIFDRPIAMMRYLTFLYTSHIFSWILFNILYVISCSHFPSFFFFKIWIQTHACIATNIITSNLLSRTWSIMSYFFNNDLEIPT